MRHLSVTEAVMRLMLRHPGWTPDDLLAELAELNFDPPTRFLVCTVRSSFLAALKWPAGRRVRGRPAPQPAAPRPGPPIRAEGAAP
jgi:hypothetical protein